jgi:hypothetical protein
MDVVTTLVPLLQHKIMFNFTEFKKNEAEQKPVLGLSGSL